MSDRSLVRRNAQQVVQPDQLLNAQVAEAQRPSILATARVHGSVVAASAAMQGAVTLSHAADVAFRVSPLGEDVYRSIVAAYGNFVVGEIQRLGFHTGGQQ